MKKIKIERATIFGFGKWVDYNIDFSTDKLACIYGNNESGKSTLQQFILFVLFGFPPKKRQFYRSKTSGKMGGRLVIADQEIGNYTIERVDEVENGVATCYLPDGVTRGESWLKERLQGLTATAFQSVFLFSALDLQQIKAMKNNELGEVLLGIGLTGADNLYTVEKQLDHKLGELFKPFGKNPRINQQLETLEKLQEKLVKSREVQATYQEKVAVTEKLAYEIDRVQTTIKQESERKLLIEKQLENLSLIIDYHQSVKKLAEYPDTIEFPEEGVKRLQQINDKLLPLQSEQAFLKTNLEKDRNKQSDLKSKKLHENFLVKIKTLLSKQHKYKENEKSRKKLLSENDQLSAMLNTELSSLNLNIDAAILADLVIPFHLERIWNDLKNEAEQIKFEQEHLEEQYVIIKRQRDVLEAEINDAKTRLLTKERESELKKKIQVHEANEITTQLRKEKAYKKTQWEKQKNKKQKQSMIILLCTLILSGLLGVFGWLFKYPMMYQLMFVFGAFGLLQWFLGKHTIKETNQLMTEEQISKVPAIQITQEEQLIAEKELTDDRENKNNVASLKTQLKTLNIQNLQWTEKTLIIKQREQRLEQKINTQIATYPFLIDLEINYWPEFYHTLKHLMSLQQKVNENEQKTEQLHEQSLLFEQQVKEVITSYDSGLQNRSYQFQLEKLENLLFINNNSQQKINQIQQAIEENIEEQTKLEQKISIYQNELQLLFREACVDSESQFYSQSKQLEQQETIRASLQKSAEQIQTIFPQATCTHIMTHQPNQNELQFSQQQLQADIDKLGEELDEKRQQLADAKAQINQLESSESYSDLNHRMMMEKEQLQQMAKEWAIQKVAKEMLVEAKRVYQEKYLATTIQKTTKYFKRITDNAYVAIYTPTDNRPFQVETSDHMRFNIDELSQGTIDQLYICLRLAIGEVISEKHKLPFIIDDAFVHFDQHRTSKMLEILEDIGLNRQVILFTCKREITQTLSTTKVTELRDASSQLV